MKAKLRRLRLLLCAIFLTFLATPSLSAALVYEYQGPDFTFATGSYTTSDHLSMYFSSLTPLHVGDYSSATDITLYMDDGITRVFSFDPSLTTKVILISSVDTTGAPTSWYIGMGVNPTLLMASLNATDPATGITDRLEVTNTIYGNAFVDLSPIPPDAPVFHLVENPVPVPEPATIILIIAGMAALAAARFRTQKLRV